jgi:hypothetical protein
MFLPNKVKSIAAVSLLSLGTIGSQVLLTPKAQAQSAKNIVPVMCHEEWCEIRLRINNAVTVDAIIVPGYSGIKVPRSLVEEAAIRGFTQGNIADVSTIGIESITLGNEKYYVNTRAQMDSDSDQVMIGGDYLKRLGARQYGNTNQLIFP